jgi:hypothetical protein
MLRNYFKIALRNLAKHKVYAFINIAGLSVAFASAFLLFLTAAHEFSFDNFHANRDRIFRVYFQSNTAKGVEKTSMMPAPLKPALQKEFGEIEYVVRHTGGRCQVRYKGKELQENIKFTDPEFFRMFTFRCGAATRPRHWPAWTAWCSPSMWSKNISATRTRWASRWS